MKIIIPQAVSLEFFSKSRGLIGCFPDLVMLTFNSPRKRRALISTNIYNSQALLNYMAVKLTSITVME